MDLKLISAQLKLVNYWITKGWPNERASSIREVPRFPFPMINCTTVLYIHSLGGKPTAYGAFTGLRFPKNGHDVINDAFQRQLSASCLTPTTVSLGRWPLGTTYDLPPGSS